MGHDGVGGRNCQFNLFDIISYRPKFGPFARLALKGRATLVLPRQDVASLQAKKIQEIYIYHHMSDYIFLNKKRVYVTKKIKKSKTVNLRNVFFVITAC
jgi:hypothetical protein